MDDDDLEKRTISFLAWLHRRGIVTSSKMALVDLRSDGRGRGVGECSTLVYLYIFQTIQITR